MSKFAGSMSVARSGLVATTDETVTYEGGVGFSRDARSELYLLAVANMVRESTFYESGADRDSRFITLAHQVTQEDPEWVAGFVGHLRREMFMRSASLVLAAEYVRAGGPNGRKVVDSALQRADEPAEMLAYWFQAYGRKLPAPVKRGVADAVRRLFTEKAALKYDGKNRAWRMGDVLELTHPKPTDTTQSDLFRFLLDRRHHPDNGEAAASLTLIRQVRAWEAAGAPLPLPEGITWERLSSTRSMDREAWEAVIPQMGYMALLRNLRNFDQAEVSDEVATQVCARLSDPDEVAKSRQFPLRFLSAWKNAPSMRWAAALEKAVELSVSNIPSLPGKTLVLIDRSGSMNSALSERSSVSLCDAAAVFGIAVAKKCEQVDVYAYDNTAERVEVTSHASILRLAERITPRGGTETWATVQETLAGHDRVVLITDEQAFPWGSSYGWNQRTWDVDVLLRPVESVYTFNLGGYQVAHDRQGQDGRYAFGGLSDAGFRMMALLEKGRDGFPTF